MGMSRGPQRNVAIDQRFIGFSFDGAARGSNKFASAGNTPIAVTYTASQITGMQPIKAFIRVDAAWRLGRTSADVQLTANTDGCQKLAANEWAEVFLGSKSMKDDGFYIRTEAAGGTNVVEYRIIYGD